MSDDERKAVFEEVIRLATDSAESEEEQTPVSVYPPADPDYVCEEGSTAIS